MGYVGICGTDVHLYKNGGFGSYVIKSPMVLGHEASATIAELGPGVKGLKVGQYYKFIYRHIAYKNIYNFSKSLFYRCKDLLVVV